MRAFVVSLALFSCVAPAIAFLAASNGRIAASIRMESGVSISRPSKMIERKAGLSFTLTLLATQSRCMTPPAERDHRWTRTTTGTCGFRRGLGLGATARAKACGPWCAKTLWRLATSSTRSSSTTRRPWRRSRACRERFATASTTCSKRFILHPTHTLRWRQTHRSSELSFFDTRASRQPKAEGFCSSTSDPFSGSFNESVLSLLTFFLVRFLVSILSCPFLKKVGEAMEYGVKSFILFPKVRATTLLFIVC